MEKDYGLQIIKTLEERGVSLRCPRCGRENFSLIGISHIPFSTDPEKLVIGGRMIPVALVGCSNCAFVMQHALVPLGIVPTKKHEEAGK